MSCFNKPKVYEPPRVEQFLAFVIGVQESYVTYRSFGSVNYIGNNEILDLLKKGPFTYNNLMEKRYMREERLPEIGDLLSVVVDYDTGCVLYIDYVNLSILENRYFLRDRFTGA